VSAGGAASSGGPGYSQLTGMDQDDQDEDLGLFVKSTLKNDDLQLNYDDNEGALDG